MSFSKIHARDNEAINVGVRDYMLRVYNYMCLGVALTGAVVWLLSLFPSTLLAIASGPAYLILFFCVLGLGFFAPRLIYSGGLMVAHFCYWVYAGLWGCLLAPTVMLVLSTQGGGVIVARAFLITSCMFAGSSLYGYVTKKDLSGFGRFFMMASIGLLVAVLFNLFMQSNMLSFVISLITVFLFAGVTAYETQAIRSFYYHASSSGELGRCALFGAFLLYGSFVTIFAHILNILRIARD